VYILERKSNDTVSNAVNSLKENVLNERGRNIFAVWIVESLLK